MEQQVTLQLSTKTITKLMVGMVLAVPAAILLTLAIMVPNIAKADTQQAAGGSQTANSNPTFNVPAGYVMVPANSNVCANTSGGSAAVGSSAVVPVAFSSVLPGNYTSTTTQTETNNNTSYHYSHSFNTRGDETNVSISDSGNGNGSNNGNGSGNNNGNNRDNVTTTTTSVNTTTNTTTNTTSNQNVGNTNNSNNSDSVVNSDDAINAVIHDSFNGNTI